MKTYVINLPKDKERRKFQERQLQHLNIDYEIVDATSVNDIDQKTYDKHRDDWQRPLRNVEVACYYSHRKLWEKSIELDQPILILEDDALLSKCMPALLKELSSLQNIDYINLEVVGRKKIVSKKSQPLSSCASKFYTLHLDRNGTGAYVLYPSAAKKLLQLEKKIGIGLSDAHINACHNLKAYQIEPAMAIQLDQCKQYGIIPPLDIKSNIGTLAKPKIADDKKWFFMRKRLNAQLKQGIKHITSIFIAKKRHITIRHEDFNHKE